MHDKSRSLSKTILLIFNFWVAFMCFDISLYSQSANENNGIIYDTVYVYDTVWEYVSVYDTIWVYDTIYVEEPIPPFDELIPIHPENIDSDFSKKHTKLSKTTKEIPLDFETSKVSKTRKSWSEPTMSAEMYFGMVLHKNKFLSLGQQHSSISETLVKELPGYNYGINLHYNKREYGVYSGVGVAVLRERFTYEESVQGEDTIRYLDLDSLLQGDTVWHIYYHKYDTLTGNLKNVVNRYTLLEFPIVFTYRLYIRGVTVSINPGFVNQFHLASVGKIYSLNGSIRDIEQAEDIVRYNLAIYGGVGCDVGLSESIEMCANVFYQHPLWYFSELSGVSKSSYGVRLGLKYTFNRGRR